MSSKAKMKKGNLGNDPKQIFEYGRKLYEGNDDPVNKKKRNSIY